MSIDINVIVTKTDDGKQYRIVCPFCKETHWHGAAVLGWRESHCHKGQYKLVEDEGTKRPLWKRDWRK